MRACAVVRLSALFLNGPFYSSKKTWPWPAFLLRRKTWAAYQKGKCHVLKLELLIAIEQEHTPKAHLELKGGVFPRHTRDFRSPGALEAILPPPLKGPFCPP